MKNSGEIRVRVGGGDEEEEEGRGEEQRGKRRESEKIFVYSNLRCQSHYMNAIYTNCLLY